MIAEAMNDTKAEIGGFATIIGCVEPLEHAIQHTSFNNLHLSGDFILNATIIWNVGGLNVNDLTRYENAVKSRIFMATARYEGFTRHQPGF